MFSYVNKLRAAPYSRLSGATWEKKRKTCDRFQPTKKIDWGKDGFDLQNGRCYANLVHSFWNLLGPSKDDLGKWRYLLFSPTFWSFPMFSAQERNHRQDWSLQPAMPASSLWPPCCSPWARGSSASGCPGEPRWTKDISPVLGRNLKITQQITQPKNLGIARISWCWYQIPWYELFPTVWGPQNEGSAPNRGFLESMLHEGKTVIDPNLYIHVSMKKITRM